MSGTSKFTIAAVLSLIFFVGIFYLIFRLANPDPILEIEPVESVRLPSEETSAPVEVVVRDETPKTDPESPTSVEDEIIPLAPKPRLVRGKWLLRGRIVSRRSRDGMPDLLVPAVKVKVYFKPHPNREEGEAAPAPQRCVTSKDGRFAFVAIPPRVWLRMEIDAPGYAYRTLSFKLSQPPWKGERDIGDIVIEPAADLQLLVVGPGGEAVSAAEVLVGRKKDERSLSLESAGIKESRRKAREIGGGRYELARVAPGTVRVQVRASGYERFREYIDPPQSGPFTVRLRAGLKIAGTVQTEDDTPIAGAVLEIDGPNIGSPRPTFVSDRDGRFLFDTLSNGEYDVEVVADGFVETEHKNVNAGLEGVVFVLRKESVFSGVVIASDDERPVVGAEVKLRNETEGDRFEERTDDRGRFRLRGLSPGRYTIKVEHDHYALFEAIEVDIAEAEALRDQVLRLDRGITAGGRVTDAETAEAVPGALVSFKLRDSFTGSTTEKREETDADGNYVLRGLLEGAYRVSIQSDDYLRMPTQTVDVIPDGENVFPFELERGAEVAGRVVDSNDQPVPGASVEIAAQSAQQIRPMTPKSPNGPGSGSFTIVPSKKSSPVKETLSDEDGYFRLRGLPPGKNYGVVANHRDYTSGKSESLDLEPRQLVQDVQLVLFKGGSIRGRVVNEDGEPISWARVDASPRPPQIQKSPDGQILAPDGSALTLSPGGKTLITPVSMPTSSLRSARTDPDGNYVITRLEPGTYTVNARADTYLSKNHEEAIEIVDDSTIEGVDFVLEFGELVSGRVVDVDGLPIAGADVRAGSERETTDLDGNFELSGLAPDKDGLVSVSFSKRDYVSRTEQLPAPSDGAFIELEVASKIVGTVVLRGSGEPVGNATIRLEKARTSGSAPAVGGGPAAPGQGFTSSGLPRGRSRSDGSFELRGISPGTYRLTASHSDFAPGVLADLVLGSGEEVPVTVELNPGGVIQGLVTGAGTPLYRASVTVSRAGGSPPVNKSARTDTKGVFFVRGLPEGPYTVRARASSRTPGAFVQRSEQVTILEGEATEVHIDLPSAIRVTGIVSSGGQPAGGGFINFSDPQSGQQSSGSKIDGAGGYSLNVAGPGNYTYQISGSGGIGARGQVVVPDTGDEVVVDIELPSGQIIGVVVDAETGAPIRRTQVLAMPGAGGGLGSIGKVFSSMRGMARSDSAGQFQINYLAEGTYSLSVTARDYSPGSQDGIEISSRASTHQVRIALERGSGFRARVVDSSGQPVRGAMALVRDTTGNMIPMQPANSDNGGQLVVRGLAQGTYQVSVLHRAFATGRFTVKVDGKDREQTFQLQDGGAARLQVVDVRRNGIAGATIQLTDSRGNNPLQDGEIFSLGAQGRGPAIVTDGQGFVSVDRIPPGSYRVTATRNGKSSRPESVRIRAGEVAEAQLTIR